MLLPILFMLILGLIMALAATKTSLGVRRIYVKVLLMLFECSQKIIEKQERKNKRYIEMGGKKSNFENKENQISRRYEPVNLDENTEEDKLSSHPDKATKLKSELNLYFELGAILDCTRAGFEAIIDDQVTSRFEAEKLKHWNLLTRTSQGYEFISWKLTLMWMCGFVLRYSLFPLRFLVCFCGVLWMIFLFPIVGLMPNGTWKRWVNARVYVIGFRILMRALCPVITFHNRQWRPKRGSICVSNHTSPIDMGLLSNDNCFSLIGQTYGGLLGFLHRVLLMASTHIWFERSEDRDKKFVLKRLMEHTSNPKNPPILIFPEGTCVNNTCVMQFKKGCFEVGSVICPVAIKYDPRFANPFWNTNRYSMIQYLYMVMTSWAIVCDVWYLPPMLKKNGENFIDFANRVKRAIAKQGGLVDLAWDGELKRSKPKKKLKEQQQEQFCKQLRVG